jgi:Circadian oscillating protein COP23
MKVKLLTRGLFIIFMVWGAVVATAQSTLSQRRAPGTFICGQDKGRPATIVQHPQRGNVTLILWTSDYFRGSGWDNQRRCEQVSSKFQQNQTRDVLKAIVSGTYNNLPVLCAFPGDEIPSQVIPCQDERVLMTLRRGDDSQAFIQQLIGLSGDTSKDPLQNGGALVSSPNNSRLQGIDMNRWVQNSPNTQSYSSPSSGNCNKLFGTCP